MRVLALRIGGSAATASQFATDMSKGASFDIVFTEQSSNLGKPGDVLVTISGSG